MDGPFGFFTLKQENRMGRKPVFIASGTGIAPFHSYVRSFPGLDYRLIHGVRYGKEAYDKEAYHNTRYKLCTSRENAGFFHGRVTDYIRENPQGHLCDYYLCGNSNMIHDVYDILREQRVDTENIYAEVYF
jgi:ferredoxin--NADP+ reductase/benzoate/toluate 1,2-dioxygenase reductase subunit